MQKRQTKVLLGLALLSVVSGVVLACGSGSGPAPGIDSPQEPPPNSRDNPGNSRESPGDSRDKPTGALEVAPSSIDNPGSQGPGPNGGGGGSACAPCDGTFKCMVTVNGKTSTGNVVLKTTNGACATVEKDKGEMPTVLMCGGGISGDGVTSGMWTATGPDSFTATASGTVKVTTSTNGQNPMTTTMMVTEMLTCTRVSNVTTVPTATATSTATPTPTTTVTPPSFDAGG